MTGTGLQPANLVLTVLPFLLSLSVVIVRVWRKIKENRFAIEDWLLIIAETILCALTCTMCKYIMVSYSGYHAEDIPIGAVKQNDLLFWRYINNILYNPILGLVKISFLITLLKLRSCNRWIVVSLWTLISVNTLFIILAVFGGTFKCWPIQKAWETSIPGYCPPRAPYIFGTIGTTIATDFLVALIPAWIIHDLQMPLKNKLAVVMFLSLPLAVTAIGCWRLQTFIAVFSLPKGTSEDPYNLRNALTNIEGNLGVIAACGPTLKWILGCFIPYFNTSLRARGYTLNSLASRQHRVRGYLQSHGDIELRTDVLVGSYTQSTKNMSWKVCRDTGGANKWYTLDAEKGIKKTTTVELECELLDMKPGQEPKRPEPTLL